MSKETKKSSTQEKIKSLEAKLEKLKKQKMQECEHKYHLIRSETGQWSGYDVYKCRACGHQYSENFYGISDLLGDK